MPRDYAKEAQILSLKYELKTDLEKLLHKNIMEEIITNKDGEGVKRRKKRRGM